MIATLQGLAFSLPVLWARVYTLGLPADQRVDRIDLVASDIYEQRVAAGEERRSLFVLCETFACLVRGIWADLTWRLEREHDLRVAAINAGSTPYPVLVTCLLALAGLAGAARLSVFHDLPEDQHVALTLALLAGPLVGVLGVVFARHNVATGAVALTAGSAALAVSAWSTVIGPVAATAGFVVGLFSILEVRNARRTSPESGRSASLTSPPRPSDNLKELVMDTPGRRERWLLFGAVAFVVSFVPTLLYAGSFPYGGTDTEIQEWYADGREMLIYGAFFGRMLGAAGLLLFFGGVFAMMRRAEGDAAGILSTVMLVGAGIGVALSMVEASLETSVGMAFASDSEFGAGGVDVQTVRTLVTVSYGLEAMASAALAVALGALAIVSLRTRQPFAPWLAWPTVAMAVLLLLNFPLFGMPQFVFALWILVASGTGLFGDRTSTAPAPHTIGNPA